jgi:hypothetical protein
MHIFTLFVFLPAMVALLGWAWSDHVRGDAELFRAVWIGIVGGLLAAVAYDVFRLPFVFAREWGLDRVVPPMDLFKVFPQFGAMILGEPLEQPSHSRLTPLVGWAYHFSNGATFGVMYLALIGDGTRRSWSWGILFALALEAGLLISPYPEVFKIPMTARFVAVTLTAHAIFGAILGWSVRRIWSRAVSLSIGH